MIDPEEFDLQDTTSDYFDRRSEAARRGKLLLVDRLRGWWEAKRRS